MTINTLKQKLKPFEDPVNHPFEKWLYLHFPPRPIVNKKLYAHYLKAVDILMKKLETGHLAKPIQIIIQKYLKSVTPFIERYEKVSFPLDFFKSIKKISLKRILLLVLAVMIAGCGMDPIQKEEALIRKSFQAIQKNNWQDYNKLTLTLSGIDLERQKLSPLKASMTYQGGVLQREEKEQQQKDFKKAVQGGEEQIDFKNSKFISLGTLIYQGQHELLSGSSPVPYKWYSVKIQKEGEEHDSKDLKPYFVVVEHNQESRLLGLEF